MKNKHTPGPWELMYMPFSDTDNGIDLKGNNGNTLIANFPTPCPVEGVAYRPGEEDAANLKLIAAAPELLEALDKMRRHYDDLCKSNPGWMGKMCLQDYALWNDALLSMDSAISKATV